MDMRQFLLNELEQNPAVTQRSLSRKLGVALGLTNLYLKRLARKGYIDLVGGRNRTGDDYEDDDELRRGKSMKRRDPMARLRKGLRPPPNPTAFWQAIGGFVMIALGLPLTF